MTDVGCCTEAWRLLDDLRTTRGDLSRAAAAATFLRLHLRLWRTEPKVCCCEETRAVRRGAVVDAPQISRCADRTRCLHRTLRRQGRSFQTEAERFQHSPQPVGSRSRTPSGSDELSQAAPESRLHRPDVRHGARARQTRKQCRNRARLRRVHPLCLRY